MSPTFKIMKTKEKAKQLVDKFYQTTPNESWINEPIGLKEEYKAWEQAKQCALIAVDELINQCYDYRLIDLGCSHGFWLDVKNEINKL